LIVLTHPTIDQMHQLGLAGMARAFAELEANPQNIDLSHAEWLALLLDREATERYERRLRARLRYARLRHQVRSRTSITEPLAVSTARCSRR
jgi:DNA replication protein DnaC